MVVVVVDGRRAHRLIRLGGLGLGRPRALGGDGPRDASLGRRPFSGRPRRAAVSSSSRVSGGGGLGDGEDVVTELHEGQALAFAVLKGAQRGLERRGRARCHARERADALLEVASGLHLRHDAAPAVGTERVAKGLLGAAQLGALAKRDLDGRNGRVDRPLVRQLQQPLLQFAQLLQLV